MSFTHDPSSVRADAPISKAQWIWTSSTDVNPNNCYTWFRRLVEIDDAPAVAELKFAADSNAQLWINGHLVRRKVTRYNELEARADRVPVAGLLRPGKNVVLALHHNWGNVITFQRTGNTRAGLYLDGSWITTDSLWRWKHAGEFRQDVDQFRGVDKVTSRIRYPIDWDARADEDPSAFHDSGYDDSGWAPAVVVSDGPWPSPLRNVETPGQRESSQRPLSVLAAGRVMGTRGNSRDSELTDSIVVPDTSLFTTAANLVSGRPVTLDGEPGASYYMTFDMLRPVHGYPFIHIENHSTARVIVGYGELPTSPYDGRQLVKTDGWIDVDAVIGRAYADTIRPAYGRRNYELPDERTARWMTVHVHFESEGSLVIHDVGIVKSQYPIEIRGSFSCGDEQIDQIVKLGLIHAELTMSDTYVDTPGREDGQWIEDARPRAMLASRWFGDVRLRELLIRLLFEGQSSDGGMHPFSPSNYPYERAQWDWSLQWIGVVADSYQWTGDTSSVIPYFSGIQSMWAAITQHIGADFIWRSPHLYGDIRNSTPLLEGDSSGIVTPWVIDRLRDSASIARAIKEVAQASRWDELADGMSEAFLQTHLTVDNDFGIAMVADVIDENGKPTGFSQAGQMIPLYDGILSKKMASELIEVAFPSPDGSPPPSIKRWNNPTWSYRALRGLSENGYHERAVAHLRERFSSYLPSNPNNLDDHRLQGSYGGPLPEYWLSRVDQGSAPGELNERHPIDPSGSHGWGAVPLLWLHEYLLGVTISTDGGAELDLKPDAAGLPFVTGTTMTPRGPVYIHYEPGIPSLIIELPQNVTGHLRFPMEFHRTSASETSNRVIIEDTTHRCVLTGGRWEFVGVSPHFRSESGLHPTRLNDQ